MSKGARPHRLTVCLLSPHPLVFSEFQRLLPPSNFRLLFNRLESTLAPELRRVSILHASLYVIDAQGSCQAAAALIENILERYPKARVLVVAEKQSDSNSFALLRLGVKGLLSYTETNEQLARALPMVAAGGFWVSRPVLSRFVDSILSDAAGHRLKVGTESNLSRREQEVLDVLLENLANKEIADRLHISERTVKFHVSNLLAKFGVRRRADLILLCYQRRPSAS